MSPQYEPLTLKTGPEFYTNHRPPIFITRARQGIARASIGRVGRHEIEAGRAAAHLARILRRRPQ